jgi:hypothetical protein
MTILTHNSFFCMFILILYMFRSVVPIQCLVCVTLCSWPSSSLFFWNYLSILLCSVDRASRYNYCKWPTWCTVLFFSIYLFQFSTCFEQPRSHHQENQLYQYSIWYVSLCVGDCLVCRSERNFPTEWHIPDVVLIQLILLMMSTSLLETSRELE